MVRICIATVIALFLCARVEAAPKLAAVSAPVDPQELLCLAQNVYFEARGEPRAGQLAVAHVVMNRVAHNRFPGTICETIRDGGRRLNQCQFSWFCDGRSDQPVDRAAWTRSLEIAQMVYTGRSVDPTGGAMWYHADYVSPDWRHDFIAGPKIGQHHFYGDGSRPPLPSEKLLLAVAQTDDEEAGPAIRIIKPGMTSDRIRIVRVAKRDGSI